MEKKTVEQKAAFNIQTVIKAALAQVPAGNGAGVTINAIGPVAVEVHAPPPGAPVGAEACACEGLFDRDLTLEQFKLETRRLYLAALLRRHRHNASAVMRILGISRRAYYDIQAKCGLAIRKSVAEV
jgi:DNA-binding NtrC family response regulator